ncbi:hypothetical protein [Caproiciproducens sp. MSJ-32]|uniref:hypothetical protein n=1 Tax=Caproiciproducens sp. MSJ-32 TaxID=2841527 RepID=UPI001C11780A|nr:hypothetical protein [Caproiciproducens sp. MSJ-32]MBU5455127.1 hypothetical protein [Caproiciproducens sp. MSJ-32]
MKYKHLIKENYNEVNNLNNLLTGMVNSYRLLIGGANELNNTSEAKKSKVKEAIDRANALGKIIDEVISVLGECCDSYIEYCKITKKFIKANTSEQIILTEINEELNFINREDNNE